MWEKIQRLLAVLAIVFVLPYVIVTLGEPKAREVYALQQASKNYITVRGPGGLREIAFEDYVCGVAALQLPMDAGLEAVKAQVVIARTNLKKFLLDHPGELLSEEYLTLDELKKKGKLELMLQATEATAGQVLTWQGELIRAPFHAVSSGHTRSGADAGLGGEYPWLTGVDSWQDAECERYLSISLWEKQRLHAVLVAAFPKAFSGEDILAQLEVLNRDDGDYVTEMRAGSLIISGERFREALGLSSSCFYLGEAQGQVRITTKGLGHGLGLSCYGAVRMEMEGAKYPEILSFYFPGCIIA